MENVLKYIVEMVRTNRKVAELNNNVLPIQSRTTTVSHSTETPPRNEEKRLSNVKLREPEETAKLSLFS